MLTKAFFFLDTSFEVYQVMLDNFKAFFECENSRAAILEVANHSCPPVLDVDALQFALEIFQEDMAYIDSFFDRSCAYRNFQENVLIPNKLLKFADIDSGGKSVYHFILEREENAITAIMDLIFKYQSVAPFAAETLFFRLFREIPSYDELWSYILNGLNTEDQLFYELIARDFMNRMDQFQLDFMKLNGWSFEDEFYDVYNLALEKKKEWFIPFEMAFGLAFREYIFNTMFSYLCFSVAPESFDYESEAGQLDFIDYSFYVNVMHLYFVERNLCEERIAIIKYLIAKCGVENSMVPLCVFRHDFPYMNKDHAYNNSFMGPLALTGALYCQTEDNIDYIGAIQDAYYADLCKFETFRNFGQIPVIIFSMGRLYVFTIFSSVLFLILYIVFCFKMYIVAPNMYQMFFESIYNFVYNIVAEQAGILAIVHFPLVFSIFNVILCGNIVGLVPYSFTVTSHLTFTFSLGLFVFIGIVLLTILNKGVAFFRLFVPTGVPKLLVPLLCVIEVISYVFRVVSLSVRLFANMMAGHALLHILLGFVPVIFNFKNLVRFLFVFPIAIIIMITLLEIGISLLQSYVFIVLISIYLRDCYGGSAH